MWLIIPTKIGNKEKTWKKTFRGLFQFTYGHIRPILNSVETKGIGKRSCY